MKTISITGYKRTQTGKSATNQIRSQGFVPCELYGNGENTHFTVFSSDFRDLVYTPETYKVNLNIDGSEMEAVLKEVQFHPLSEEILHVDFLEVQAGKPLKLKLPIRFVGNSAGVKEGGKLVKKLRSLNVKGMPETMPDAIEVDITHLGMGKSIKVSEVSAENVEILNSPSNPIASIEIPRGLRGKTEEAAATTGKKK